ncbi:hypothetical protein IFO70_34615 [Phormidium tenue FACHB-886]|nr:hypothetical protein [Phormidium tenue FACHB-886]
MTTVNPLPAETPEESENAGGHAQASRVVSEINNESNSGLNQNIGFNTRQDAEPKLLTSPPQHRYLIAQIGQQQLAFPLQWVSELILVEQSHILSLPFYDPMLLGVLQYKGDIVPLVAAPLESRAETAAAAQRLKMKHTLTAVRLNQTANKLAGVGVTVDRVVERFVSAPQTELPAQVRVFQLEDVPSALWQPR